MENVETMVLGDVSLGERQRLYPALKRGFDVLVSAIGLLATLPLGLVISAVIWLSDRGPVFYRQRRVGFRGQHFYILKFRSMVPNADRFGPSVTKGRDPRVTRIGRLLRKSKLDELPQLWNVLVGEMSFVGPRPEVPRFVDRYTREQRALLEMRPGITDLATLLFRNEESLLAGAADVEAFYVDHCIPRKFELNMRYARQASLWRDCLIIAATVCPYWLAVAFGYLLVLLVSLIAAFELRFDFNVPAAEYGSLGIAALIVLPIQLLSLVARREMTGLLSYFGAREVRQLAFGLLVAAGFAWVGWVVTGGQFGPPRSVILIDALVAFCALCGVRSWLRDLRERRLWSNTDPVRASSQRTLRVGVIGAGELGAWLTSELNTKAGHGRRVDVVFDDDPQKWHKHLHGIPVAGMPECILEGAWSEKLDEVIIAIPDASPKRLEEVREVLSRARLQSKLVPGLRELLSTSRMNDCVAG